jgi:hypothetical protein
VLKEGERDGFLEGFVPQSLQSFYLRIMSLIKFLIILCFLAYF